MRKKPFVLTLEEKGSAETSQTIHKISFKITRTLRIEETAEETHIDGGNNGVRQNLISNGIYRDRH